jgi:hypothetical protein
MSVVNPGRQQNAFSAINDYAALAAQINSILSTIAVLKQREATHAYSVVYNATATYTLNADGTPGSQDGSPTSGHPMVGQYVSATDVSGFVGYIVNDLYNFLTGVAGPTTADRRPAITGMLP